MAEHYDTVIIGAGQGGGPIASAFAQSGKKTALIERKHVGGTCVNTGCTPTKTMIASARVAYLARRAADYGIQVGEVKVDQPKIRQRKRDTVEAFRDGSLESIENTKGLTLIRGTAAFIGQKALRVTLNEGGTLDITADLIVIDVGSRSRDPNMPGVDTVEVLHEDTLMELDHTPGHLLILGGSYIGLEFGQMFRRFGSAVTIIETGDQLASREDPDIAEEVANILREDGITIHLNTEATRVEKTADGITLTLKTPEGEQTVTGTHLLAGIGRIPNSDTLDLDQAGIKIDERGYIEVDERLETNVSGIYAIGEVAGNPKFTHISYDDFRILRENLLNNGSRTTSDRPVPYTMFIDPQLGRVGLTEQQAKEQGLNYRVAKLPMSKVARAREVGETRGVMKALVDADSGQILGAAILGYEGGEVVTVLQVAMMGKLHYHQLKDGVFAHPTTSESLNNLFTTLES